jgi:hypothetical protein
MRLPSRVAIFERNLLWHVAALGAGFAYSLSVVVTTEKVAFGPMCFLFNLPLLAALRVRAASMLDQAEAYRRTGVAWLVGNQTVYALSVFDAGGSAELVHKFLRDSWMLGFVLCICALKASADALLADPAAPGTKLARAVFFTSLALKVAVTLTLEYTLFWLGFAVMYETTYRLVNEYIDSCVQLAALTARNEQLVGEKERLAYMEAIATKACGQYVPPHCASGNDSDHPRSFCGSILGAMQDPEVTAKQQECATSVDNDEEAKAHNTEASPDTITTPLFLANRRVEQAGPWMPVARLSPESEVSIVSSALLSIKEAAKNAPPTWAPAPPKEQPFRRRGRAPERPRSVA